MQRMSKNSPILRFEQMALRNQLQFLVLFIRIHLHLTTRDIDCRQHILTFSIISLGLHFEHTEILTEVHQKTNSYHM